MNLSNIKLTVGQIERTLADNLLLVGVVCVAILLAGLIFGGMMLDGFLARKRARDKARAAEKLRKHLAGLPSYKS